jgi:hypothetical protein
MHAAYNVAKICTAEARQSLETFSILTTTPNAVTSTLHDPHVSHPRSSQPRLVARPGMTNVAVASELLKPYDAPDDAVHPRENSD